METVKTRVAVTGDVATQLLTAALVNALKARGVEAEIFEAPFDQVRRQLLIPEAELHRFAPKFVLVWEAVERWLERDMSVEARLREVEALCAGAPGTVLYVNAAEGVGVDTRAVRGFNAGLDALAERLDNLRIVELSALMAEAGRRVFFDPMIHYTATLPLTPEGQAALAARVADVVAAGCGCERKCVVVDLDGTLWGGIAGEDGVEGLEIGNESPLGRAHADFQRWLKRLKANGMLLAVCSKNDRALVDEVFAARREMPLSEDDFVEMAVNWEPKAANVAVLAERLNLGLDAFVFLDDRKVEREAMRKAHPELTVPELPEDPAEWIPFLCGLNLFETAARSEDDAFRTERYRAEQARQARRAAFASEDEFLKDLQTEAEEVPFGEESFVRVARLTQRTNQFNLTTRRYTEQELKALAADPDVVPLVMRLRDRFGDYGIVSVMLGRRKGVELEIDTWLMSCRAIGRGLEKTAFARFVEKARALGVKTIIGRYIPTAKNGIVKDLYRKLGFSGEDGLRFEVRGVKP